ncbi:interleukin-12 subunit beta [Pogona vitticeps]
MACLLLFLLSSLALGIHSEIKQEVAETVHFVESNWSADDTVPPEKLVLICNISQEEADSVYWTKNQKWQGNGKHLQITVQEPPDAGNYFCWSNTTHELLTNATVYLTKIYPSGEIANPILRRLPESKIYFKCTANNYSGIFTCIWISAIKETELMFKIGSHMKSQGNASEEIVCDEPVNDSSERNLKRYSASCRKQNSTCPSTEEYQPIEMVLQVFHGFVYEDHRHTFFIKDILKPDISECYNNKGLLTWTPPQTWSTPVSYYGLTYQIKMHGQICEVSSATILQNENTLSCYNRRCSKGACIIRSRDRYNINSAWSNWSSCKYDQIYS